MRAKPYKRAAGNTAGGLGGQEVRRSGRCYLDEVDLGHAALEHVLAGVGRAGLIHVGQNLEVGGTGS